MSRRWKRKRRRRVASFWATRVQKATKSGVKIEARSPTRTIGPAPTGALARALLVSMDRTAARFGSVRAAMAAEAPTKPTSSARVNRQNTSARARSRERRSSSDKTAATPARSSQAVARTLSPSRCGSGRHHMPGEFG